MASQCAVTQQQQIKQYLRKHKNKWREETKQTVQSPTSNIVENSSTGSRSERVSTTNTTSSLVPKSKPRKPAFSSSRQQPVRRGKTTIDHLPDEIIHQIFSYLGANELLVAARICKRWHSLANDNLLWVKVFQTYVGSSDSVGSPQAGDVPFSYWKSQCIQRCVSQRNKEAVRQLRKPHPYTGLPRDTQKVLQQCGIKWLLVLRDLSGNEHELPSRDTFHFSMATVVRCYGLLTPPLSNVRQIKLYSLNPLFFDKGKALINSPYQRSLLLEVDLKWDNIVKTTRPAASDDLVNLYVLPQGLMVATWKADGGLAFISLCLHQHQLVQRCLNGRPDSIFLPKLCKPQADDIDSTYGLHDYSCTVELHSQRQSIWSQQFRGLHCRPHSLVGGYAVLDLIRPGFSSDHSIISQKLLLPWKTDAFKGKLENVTLMDVTLLDDRGKPFWCVSSPVHISNTGQADRLSFDYSLEGSCRINYLGAQGKVNMELNWSPEREQFFITGLQVGVSLVAVNDWFSTNYK